MRTWDRKSPQTHTTTRIDPEDEFGLELPLPIFRIRLDNLSCARPNVASNYFRTPVYLRLRIEHLSKHKLKNTNTVFSGPRTLVPRKAFPHAQARTPSTSNLAPNPHTHRTHTDTQTHITPWRQRTLNSWVNECTGCVHGCLFGSTLMFNCWNLRKAKRHNNGSPHRDPRAGAIETQEQEP